MKKKNTSTRTNQRARTKELARIREAITESYHDLSKVDRDDIIAGPAGLGEEGSALKAAVEYLGLAIIHINRQMARKPKNEPTTKARRGPGWDQQEVRPGMGSAGGTRPAE